MNFWNFNSKLQGGSWGMEFMKLLSGNCGWDGIFGILIENYREAHGEWNS
jgi:hypothetical protein